jgi:hypothetical protein
VEWGVRSESGREGECGGVRVGGVSGVVEVHRKEIFFET